ncbi:MAG: sulfur transferase domain-containing protein [Gemmatimonadaceae bacterium]
MPNSRKLLVALVAVISSATSIAAQQITKRGPIAHLAEPITLDTTGSFNSRAVKVGEDMFISGQPTERGLRELRAHGVTVVINLRTPKEMATQVPFNEDSLVNSLGMRYVYIPVRGDSAYPYTPATVTTFGQAIAGANGKVLLHCTIGWRASHLWAAYLIKERNVPVEDALSNARTINLMDTHRMGTNGRQPVEDFLDRSLPTLGHPSTGK